MSYDYSLNEDPENYPEEEMMNCDYGAEFCEDPFMRQMGLCTTECKLYFKMVKDQSSGDKAT